MRFLSPVRERISSRAAIVGIAGLLVIGGAAVLFGAAAPAFGGSAGRPQRGSAAHSVGAHSVGAPGSPYAGGSGSQDLRHTALVRSLMTPSACLMERSWRGTSSTRPIRPRARGQRARFR